MKNFSLMMQQHTKSLGSCLFAVLLAMACLGHLAVAQSATAGDIAGTVTDPTGAAIPGATVSATNVSTGETRTAITGNSGSYRLSLLSPGLYKVTIGSSSFSTVTEAVTVSIGTISTDNVKLSIGSSSTVVEVSAAPETVNTTNADVTTTFTAEQVQAMPNPGNDLTFVAQTAPGSIMNTGTAAGGYGNFSSFGISGLSNMFTLDGGYENDPFLNLNNTGASNLTLGNNEVDTVTVISPAYSSQYGGLGGAQVNEITVSGGNRVHGNLSYYWDGRVLNSNDWFNKQNQAFNQQQNIPVFVNANQYAASIGGPIVKEKLFFFVNTEGIRATTPSSGQVYAPSAAYENCALTGTGCLALNNAADAQCLSNPNSTCVGNNSYGPFAQAAASQIPLLTTIFNTYNNSPFRPAASAVTPDPNDVTAVSYYANSQSNLTEWLLTGRLDYHISEKDNFSIHYKQDHGTQPTYTDLIDPRFSAQSPQPAWEGQMSETHSFTANLVNQLTITGNYYSAPFQNTNNYLPIAPFTLDFIDGDLSNNLYGGEDYAFPQGRRVSGYQVIDDVSYSKGRNSIRWGYNFRRDNVTDLDQSRAVAGLAETSVESFSSGIEGYVQSQYFPLHLELPIAVYNQGGYVQEEYKIAPNLTLIAGLRVERNSNPTCLDNCFQRLAATPLSLATGTTVPYNAATAGGYINASRHRVFNGLEKASVMPRLSFNYQPFSNAKTVIRGGFGMFTDTPPGLIADTVAGNAPNNFHAASYGPDAGYPNQFIDPSTAGSGGANARASAAAFEQQFNAGGTYTTTAAAVSLATGGGRYSVPSFTTTAPFIKYPTYEEYSLAVEQAIGSKMSISATYAGNHGYHEPFNDGTRNLSRGAFTYTNPNTGASTPYTPAGSFFPSLATARPITSFATIANIQSGASSNFNGVVLTAQRRSKNLSVNFNYEFAKALDEVSNGGLEPFAPDAGDAESILVPGNVHANYGRADYDVRHNVTSSFVYELPTLLKGDLAGKLLGGFEFSGDVFHQSGLPYTITESSSSVGVVDSAPAPTGGAYIHANAFSNGAVNLVARQLNNSFDHHCGGGGHALLADGTNPHPCNFITSFANPTNFGQQTRNTLTGPSYTNVNFGAFKTFGFNAPFIGGMKLKLGAQFFNLFNHPNFQNPGHNLSSSVSSTYGAIASTVGAPTSILGSVGGADATPRLIQLHGELRF